MRKKGFTLIELIVSVAVLAVIMYSVIAIFITTGAKGVNAEVFSVAQSLAEDKLEEMMGKGFSAISSEAQTYFDGDLQEFSYEITVSYVSKEALDVPVGSATDYKKIQVRVNHSKLGNPASLEAVRANI